MHTKISLIDHTGQGQGIEGVHKVEIDILVVLSADFVIEVHGLRNLAGLVVASQHDNLPGVSDFDGHQQQSHLAPHWPAVDVVTQEN